MVTPTTVFDFHVDTEELEVRKVQQVPSGYDASEYMTERVLVMARDGVQVPVSIVRRRDTPVDGTGPLYLYGYGAYGLAMPPSFSTTRLSLLDRGFIFAIAHIRAATTWGITGTRRESWTGAPTLSTTSWTRPAGWWSWATGRRAA